MTKNDPITNALNDYVDENAKTSFAFMVTGEWGAGKTHFIKKYKDQHNDWVKKGQNIRIGAMSPKPIIYISLYGIETLENLGKQLFMSLYPRKDKVTYFFSRIPIKNVSVNIGIPKVAALNFSGALNFSIDLKKIGKISNKIFAKLDNAILVFDDLERCSVPIVDLFGFINQLVEHNQQKVILIANEDKLKKGQNTNSDTYNEIKEKLIGISLELQADPEEILKDFIQDLPEGAARNCAGREKDTILYVFEKLGIKNYRSLNIALFDFCRLVDKIKAVAPFFIADNAKAKKAMEQLLILFLVINMQARRNDKEDISLEDLVNYHENIVRNKIFQKKFDERIRYYLDFEHILSPDIIANFLLKGEFDGQNVKSYLQNGALFPDKSAPIWLRFRDILNYSWNENALQKTLQEIERELNHKKITDLDSILQLAATFIRLQEQDHFYPDFLQPDIVSYFKDYVHSLGNVSGAWTYKYDATSHHGGWYSLHTTSDNPKLKELIEVYENVKRFQQSQQEREKAGEIIPLLENSIHQSEFYNWLKKNSQNPCFHHLSTKEIAEVFFTPRNDGNKNFLNFIRGRIENVNETQNLKCEKSWFEELEKELRKRADNLNPPFKSRAHKAIDFIYGKNDL